MRNVISYVMVSLDGFMEGPDGELDWHVVDDEFHEYSYDMLCSVDTILFGRLTYEHMAVYWPTPQAVTSNPSIANKMNHLPKVVFSKTLEKVEWGTWDNVTVIKGNINEEMLKLKQQPGKDMVILGSSVLTSSLMNLGLIDEIRMVVNPVILGAGKPFFQHITDRMKPKLQRTRRFRSGNVALHYEL